MLKRVPDPSCLIKVTKLKLLTKRIKKIRDLHHRNDQSLLELRKFDNTHLYLNNVSLPSLWEFLIEFFVVVSVILFMEMRYGDRINFFYLS